MTYWDHVWQGKTFLDYKQYVNPTINYGFVQVFKDHQVKDICDIGCGFGKYSVVSAYKGFNVSGTDISSHAISITKEMMQAFELGYHDYKVGDITAVPFGDKQFDAVIAHAVIDHVVYEDAKQALKEFSRITKEDGILYLSFDGLEEDDLTEDHHVLEDGSKVYINGSRKGMVFRYYTDEAVKDLISDYPILSMTTNARGERNVYLKNSKLVRRDDD